MQTHPFTQGNGDWPKLMEDWQRHMTWFVEQMVRRRVRIAGVMAEPDTVLYNLYGTPFRTFMDQFKEWFAGEFLEARLEQVNRWWFDSHIVGRSAKQTSCWTCSQPEPPRGWRATSRATAGCMWCWVNNNISNFINHGRSIRNELQCIAKKRNQSISHYWQPAILGPNSLSLAMIPHHYP